MSRVIVKVDEELSLFFGHNGEKGWWLELWMWEISADEPIDSFSQSEEVGWNPREILKIATGLELDFSLSWDEVRGTLEGKLPDGLTVGIARVVWEGRPDLLLRGDG